MVSPIRCGVGTPLIIGRIAIYPSSSSCPHATGTHESDIEEASNHPATANRILDDFIENKFQPVLRKAVEYRGLTIAIGFSGLIITMGLIAGGRISATFLPRIPANRVQVNVELPYGSSVEYTKEVQAKLVKTAQETAASFGPESGRFGASMESLEADSAEVVQ